jgi:hypothetical protein
MLRLTRLERLLVRLEAQHACLDWAFGEIADRAGPIFELGLGHGRTYDHLRTHLPDREIYVFDREVDCFADCRPPRERLILGEIGDTLAAAAHRFQGQVALAHSDLGSYTEKHNLAMSALVSRQLPVALAQDAIVVSDLPLEAASLRPLALPKGAREGRYFLYRRG